jgi:hypothetical protein
VLPLEPPLLLLPRPESPRPVSRGAEGCFVLTPELVLGLERFELPPGSRTLLGDVDMVGDWYERLRDSPLTRAR